MYIATQIVYAPSQTKDMLDASQYASEVIDELRYAIYITEHTDKSVEFAVADRNNDGKPEVIRYEWSGTAGDALMRSFNHGTAHKMIESIQEFNLTYDIKEKSEEISNSNESAEQVLVNWDDTSSLSEDDIKSDKWWGQYFQPSLPANATSWKVTKVKIRAKREGPPTGETFIQLRPAAGDMTPTSTVLEQVSMHENTLTSSFSWKEFTYSNVSGLSPGTGLCLVLEHENGTVAGKIEYQGGGVTAPDSAMLESGDQGSSWSVSTDKALQYYIYGTYTTTDSLTITRRYVTGVGLSLMTGTDASSRVHTRATVLNSPELLNGFWELQFFDDPRTEDTNFDGIGDWADSEATFDPASLSNGIWYAPNESSPDRVMLNTVPDHDFLDPITVVARFRATSLDGWGTAFWINADRSGSQCAGIVASSWKPDANTQELWVGWYVGGYTWAKIYTVAPNDFIDLRLIIDPASDTLSVFIGGVYMDTFTYDWGYADDDAMAWIYADGCSGEFDYVSIRVSDVN